MANELRTICYDTELQAEAYRFQGVAQKFPHHFHDYYVIGFIEGGQRALYCNNREFVINPGDITLFNPRDVHACAQIDGHALDYRCINLQPEAMEKTTLEITGQAFLPRFSQQVLFQSELAETLKELHRMICQGEGDFIKEEQYLLLMGHLIQEYADSHPLSADQPATEEVKQLCDYMEAHYEQTITLDALSRLVSMSKYHLIRTFTRQKGIPPYNYLQAVRIDRGKKLLEQGVSPAETAFATGFSDQSHFTNYFKRFIGLTPRQYMRIFS